MYGAATVGERGQVSIPADARKDLKINSGDKLVVFGNRINGAVILIKANIFEDFADFFMTKLNKLGEHAQAFFDHLQATDTSETAEPAESTESAEDSASAPAADPS
jgi:AbrB family looped-hinge helix DNA binding protein